VVEDIHLQVGCLQLVLLVWVTKIPKASIVVRIAMGGNHGVQVDCSIPVIAEELPVHEISGVLVAWEFGTPVTAVNQDVTVVGRANQYSVSLSHVDDVDFEKRLTSQGIATNPPLSSASLHPSPGTPTLLNANTIAP
jgi:hypothetical protein